MNTVVQLNYLDTHLATVQMLRDYYDQKWKAEYGKDKVRQIQSSMECLPATLGKIPVNNGSGSRAEDALIAGIDRKAIAEYSYQQACEYMETMDACLSRLSVQERRLLELRYIDYHTEGNGIARIMEEFHVGQAEAYRRSNRALMRLKKLLFW